MVETIRIPALLAIATLAASASLLLPDARSDAQYGLPKAHCEGSDDRLVHEYVGSAYWNRRDVSYEIDGEGAHDAVFVHTHVAGRADGSHLAPERATDWRCNAAGEIDGHAEFAIGGAVLATSGGQGGAQLCLQEDPHHGSPTIHVEDSSVMGTAVTFFVLSDWPLPGSETAFPCGDGILEPCWNGDMAATCNPNDEILHGQAGGVTPSFGPGANGAYYVFVQGTTGHVWTT